MQAPSRPTRRNPFIEAAQDFAAIARGLGVTLRNLADKPVTLQYPEQQPDLPARHRGRHVLRRHENGLEKCRRLRVVRAGRCPAKAIFVEGAENPPDSPISITWRAVCQDATPST